MRVETFASIPADLSSRYSDATKNQFFQQWADSRAQDAQVTGVFVLICREPSHLQVEVGKKTLASGIITQANRTQIRDALLTSFRQKQYDQGLSSAIDAFAAALQSHANNPPAEAPAASSSANNPPPAYSYPSTPSQRAPIPAPSSPPRAATTTTSG
jgi:uncharacterized membrane protein YgcG